MAQLTENHCGAGNLLNAPTMLGRRRAFIERPPCFTDLSPPCSPPSVAFVEPRDPAHRAQNAAIRSAVGAELVCFKASRLAWVGWERLDR
jgi:hypothetical protein